MPWPTGHGNYLRDGRPFADSGSTGIDDGDLDGLDLQAWDRGATNCYSPDCPSDLTGDGRVNEADLEVFSKSFGH